MRFYPTKKLLGLSLLIGFGFSPHAQFSQQATVANYGGGTATGSTFSSIVSMGEATATPLSIGETYQHFGGFIGQFPAVILGGVLISDSLALVSFYQALDGDNWTDRSNWLEAGRFVTEWFGVETIGNRVSEISLLGNNLNGDFPAEIGALTELRNLTLLENQITGIIPPQIGSLRNLETLALGANSTGALTGTNYPLAGTIPSQIGNLKNLLILVLGENNLEGSIPREIGELENLTILALQGNNFSGSLPASMSGLQSLNTLSLNDNDLTGIFDLRTIGTATIDLSGNRLEFNDLINNATVSGLNYSNQQAVSISPAEEVQIPVGENQLISYLSGIAGGNQYQWFLEDEAVEGATSANYFIENIGRSNMGAYSLRITNPVVPDLTLESDPVNIFATAVITVEILDSNGDPLTELLDGYLLDTERQSQGFDTVEFKLQRSESRIVFEPVVLSDFLISVDANNPEEFIPTYYEDEFLWDEADSLKLFGDSTVTITMTSVPGEEDPTAEGVVSGFIEEDFSESEGRVDARRRAARRKCGLRKRRTGGRTDQDEGVFDLFAYGETDDNGEFEFGFLPEGTYRFFVEYPGIPLDESSFVQFVVGEAGVSDDEFTLAATVTESGIVVELVLGITKDFFTNFTIFPNPTIDVVNINYDKIISDQLRYELLDLSGRKFDQRSLEKSRNGKLKIDMTEYESGTYLIRFIDEQKKTNNTLTYKIIKK